MDHFSAYSFPYFFSQVCFLDVSMGSEKTKVKATLLGWWISYRHHFRGAVLAARGQQLLKDSPNLNHAEWLSKYQASRIAHIKGCSLAPIVMQGQKMAANHVHCIHYSSYHHIRKSTNAGLTSRKETAPRSVLCGWGLKNISSTARFSWKYIASIVCL